VKEFKNLLLIVSRVGSLRVRGVKYYQTMEKQNKIYKSEIAEYLIDMGEFLKKYFI
jgi:hypothetical protein